MLVKLAYLYNVDELSLLMLRMLFALPFFLAVGFWKRKTWRQKPLAARHYLNLVLLGSAGYYLASLFDFKGLTYITASLERLILFTYPTLVLIFSALFLKKKIRLKQMVSILITYAGLAVIFLDKGGITAGTTEDVITGSSFIMLSAITYAAYITGADFMVRRTGTLRLTVWVMSISCLSVIIHFLISNASIEGVFQLQAEVYGLAVLMALFATVLPAFMINQGIKKIGGPNVSVIGSIGPVSTIVLSMIFLGEQLSLIQAFGALIIIAGVAVLSISRT